MTIATKQYQENWNNHLEYVKFLIAEHFLNCFLK